MKKVVLLLMLNLAIVPATSRAEIWSDYESGVQWEYTTSGSTAIICSAQWLYGSESCVIIPSRFDDYNVVGIEYYALQNLYGVSTIIIPGGVYDMQASSFTYCSSLQEIQFDSFNWHFFSDNGLLYNSDGTTLIRCPEGASEVSIPTSVDCIGYGAFENCSNVGCIMLPDDLLYIEPYAFSGCENLSSIEIPNKVKSIGSAAFRDCNSLQEVRIPPSVSSIGELAFAGCQSLRSILVEDGNSNYCSIDGAFYNKQKTKLLCCPAGLSSFDIPDGVTDIDEAFGGCVNLKSLGIPSSLKTIDKWSFWQCFSLKTINVTRGDKDRVMTMFAEAGYDISKYSFIEPLLDGGPYELEHNGILWQFDVRNQKIVLTKATPASSAAFIGKVEIPRTLGGLDVVEIGDRLFTNQGQITEVVIPASVFAIGTEAFAGCTSLVSVDLPNGLPDIACSSFCGCTKLEGVVVPESVTNVGANAFSGCIGMRSVIFKDGLESIGEEAFKGCSSIIRLMFPSTLETIGCSAFEGCTSLDVVLIQERVYSVGDNAFRNCDKLRAIDVCVGDLDRIKSLISKSGLGVQNLDFRETTGTCEVLFDSQGGSCSETKRNVNFGSLLGQLPVPYKSGFSFVGWYEQGSGGALFDGSAPVKKGIKLYAHWIRIFDLSVRQRYPWNGLVDVEYSIDGDATGLEAKLSVVDCDAGKTYNATKFQCGMQLSPGRHRAVWSSAEEGVSIISTNVYFTLSLGRIRSGYLVVDLTEGTSAGSYECSLPDDLSGQMHLEEYKTNKLIMRRIAPGSIPGRDGCAITKPYYIGVYEVTQRQYFQVMGSSPSRFKGDARPVESVSYSDLRGSNLGLKWPQSDEVDSLSFMGVLRKKTGIRFDLPTEAQWEYAARAGTSTELNNGSDDTSFLYYLGRYADNCYDGRGGFSEHTVVGSYMPNAWGLYDTHGNAFEMCLDNFAADGNGELVGNDPLGVERSSSYTYGSHVIRGGSCGGGVGFSVMTARFGNNEGIQQAIVGFRLACPAEGISGEFCVVSQVSSERVRIDTRAGSSTLAIDGPIEIVWDASWCDQLDATVTVRVDDEVLFSKNGSGVESYYPSKVGTHRLSCLVTTSGGSVVDTMQSTIDLSSTIAHGVIRNGEAIIPEGTTKICATAFANRTDLRSIFFPESVKTVEYGAFKGCANLRTVYEMYDAGNKVFDFMRFGLANMDNLTWIGVMTVLPGGERVTTGGDQRWYFNGNSTSAHNGSGAMKSSYVEKNGASWIETSVSGPAQLSFWWRASSEPNCDKLRFLIDGNEQCNISGSSDWLQRFFYLPYGQHTIQWRYTKDSGGVSGDDCGWVDSIEIKRYDFETSDNADGTLTITGSSGQIDGVLVIPDSISGRRVTAIAEHAFEERAWLDAVVLPATIERLGYESFAWCGGLRSIHISDLAKWCKIDCDNAGFSQCDLYLNGMLVTDLSVPSGTSELKQFAFSGIRSIKNIYLPSGLSRIGDLAFYECTGVSAVSLPAGLIEIGDGAFWGCSSMTGINIPAGVAKIGRTAFYQCSSMVSVSIPNSVAEIGDSAFQDCGKLTSVVLPPTITRIGEQTFCDCTSLASIDIPESVTNIARGAFISCSALQKIVLPSSVKSIASMAFYDCTSLTEISIPQGVVEIGSNAFMSCGKLKTIRTGVGDSSRIKTMMQSSGFNTYGVTFIESIIDLASALGGVDEVSTGGAAKWFGDNSQTYDGVGAARSGVITGGQSSWMSIEIEGPADLSFYWKVSSEVSCDNLVVTVDGAEKGRISGIQAWMSKAITIEDGGKHIVKWTYSKDGSVDNGYDCGWVDCLKIDKFHYVKFDANGGSISQSKVKYKRGESYGTLPAASRLGYSFEGWFTLPSGGDRVTEASNSDVSDNLYAHWSVVSYALTYVDTEGRVVNDPSSYTVNDSIVFTPLSDSPGLHFKGWSPSEVPIGTTGDLIVTAKWDKRTPADLIAGGDSVSMSGNSFWNAVWKDGGWVLQSGEIGDRQMSTLSCKVNGAGALTFKWKVSSDCAEGWHDDYLNIEVDGQEEAWIGGEKGWIEQRIELSANGKPHEVKWNYIKDKSGSAGEDCGWLKDVVWTPDAVAPTFVDLAKVFGEDSDVVKNITDDAELATFNGFLKDCSINSASDLKSTQKQYAYQSFKLSEIMTAPQLFEEEPILKIDDLELTGGNLSLTISLTAGAEEILLAKTKLESKIRVGTTLGNITGEPTIVTRPTADGKSLAFTIVPPGGSQGFVKVQID